MGIVNQVYVQAALITFIMTGFLQNVVQLVALILFYSWNKNLYRRIAEAAQVIHWSIVSHLGWRAGSELKIYISDEDLEHIGKEAAILITNHRYSIDFLSTVLIPDQFGRLGQLKAFQKHETMFLPIVGWGFWFTENIFLRRDAKRDVTAIKEGLVRLVESKLPFWLVLYAEGSRFTENKHERSEEIATEKGWAPLTHHLQPRPTGFTKVWEVIKESKVQQVPFYDVTVQLQDNIDQKVSRLLRNEPVTFHVYIRRLVANDELIKSEEDTGDWIRKLYQEKDMRFDKLLKTGTLVGHKASFPTGAKPAREQSLPKPTNSALITNILLLTVFPACVYLFYLLGSSSYIGLVATLLLPISFHVLLNKIIKSGDISSSSSHGLKKTS